MSIAEKLVTVAENVPKVYHAGQLDLVSNTEALKGNKSGKVISITDISPVEHDVKCYVSSDTVQDLSTVKIQRLGKNLFNPNLFLETPNGTQTGWECKNGYYRGNGYNLRAFYHKSGAYYECPIVSNFAENTQYTLAVKGHIDNDTSAQATGFFFVYTDGTSSGSCYINSPQIDETITLTSREGKTIEGVYVTYATQRVTCIKEIQLEKGTTATEFEPYIKPTQYSANADGTVEGLTSLYPTTTLLTDTKGVIITAQYIKDIDKAFEERLAALEAAMVNNE